MSNSSNPLSAIATPGVSKLKPYPPGKPIAELEREYGITDIIKLASNENPLGPSPKALAAMQTAMSDLALYPDGNGFDLKQAISSYADVPMDHITLGNGSSDILDFILRAVVNPQDEVIYSKYSFALYPILTQMVSGRGVETPAQGWGHDLQAMRQAITPRTKVIFIANPNNPTGTYLSASELEAFVGAVPRNVLVLIDEAYHEYVAKSDYATALPWVRRYPNLIVARTFSKAFGLAGLRVGYGIANPVITDLLNRVRPPFNVNSLALVAATAAMRDHTHIDKAVQLNAEGMRYIEKRCAELGLGFIPSVGNFICIDMGRVAMPVYEQLLRAGVIVRPVANYDMPNFIRVTVGLPEQNKRFMDSLAKIVSEMG